MKTFVPRTVKDLLDDLSHLQEDEYLFLDKDGNLRSSLGGVVNIGHYVVTHELED